MDSYQRNNSYRQQQPRNNRGNDRFRGSFRGAPRGRGTFAARGRGTSVYTGRAGGRFENSPSRFNNQSHAGSSYSSNANHTDLRSSTYKAEASLVGASTVAGSRGIGANHSLSSTPSGASSYVRNRNLPNDKGTSSPQSTELRASTRFEINDNKRSSSTFSSPSGYNEGHDGSHNSSRFKKTKTLNRNSKSSFKDNDEQVSLDENENYIFLKELKMKQQTPASIRSSITNIKLLVENFQNEGKNKQLKQSHQSILKNSNVFVRVRDEEAFKKIYDKYHNDKEWLKQNIPKCQVGFHKLSKTAFYIQLYQFTSVDFVFALFYLFNVTNSQQFSVHIAVHESTKLQSIKTPINDFNSMDFQITLAKQTFSACTYPGFVGYQLSLKSPSLIFTNNKALGCLFQTFGNQNWKFDGSISSIKDKFRKTVTIQSYDFEATLSNQQFFYSNSKLLQPIKQNKIVNEFWDRLHRLSHNDVIKQIKLVENKSSLLANQKTAPTTTARQKLQPQKQPPVQQGLSVQKQAQVSRFQSTADPTSSNLSPSSQPVKSRFQDSLSLALQQPTQPLSQEKVVDLCLKIINDSVRQLDVMSAKSKSAYAIVKAFVKVPRYMYSDLTELSKFCQKISYESNCNVIILSYINHHQSFAWFRELNLPWISQLGESESKILTIGGVVGSCKLALDLIKKDIERQRGT
ncbi:hypothetical protein ACO0QE_002585 [Hanseniaspora vineae]